MCIRDSNLPLWKFVLGLNLDSSGAWNQADYNAYYLLPRDQAPAAMEQVVGERLSSLGLGGLLELFWKKSQAMWGSLEYLYWGFGHLNGEAPVLGSVTLAQCLNALNYLDRGIFLLAFLLAGGASALWLWKGAGEGARLPVMLCFLLCGYYGAHLFIDCLLYTSSRAPNQPSSITSISMPSSLASLANSTSLSSSKSKKVASQLLISKGRFLKVHSLRHRCCLLYTSRCV